MQQPAPSVGDVPDDVSTVAYDSGDETIAYPGDGDAADALTTTSSRFSKGDARRMRSTRRARWCRASARIGAAVTAPPSSLRIRHET